MEKHGIQVIQSEEDADRLIVTTAPYQDHGCDTTSAFFGHGKAKLLTALKRNPQPKEQAAAFLNPSSTPVEIAAAGKQVIVTMNGGKPNSPRYQLFTKAAAKANFKLARLPPTADAAKNYFTCIKCYVIYLPDLYVSGIA
ncbi:hypothetical protein JTB14_015814 [Gonioctena quinquepunctata]|nr:hypothetical protein JTB14_015814 [Gonioctena quinquepunctata]